MRPGCGALHFEGDSMQASRFEFRFRYLIHGAIFTLCFVAPWDFARMGARGPSLWSALAVALARTGAASFGAASAGVVSLGIFFAFAGAALRTWGSAYLGAGVVEDSRMHGGGIVADGPYRHMRNPLYAGTWLHTLGLALAMPWTGGIAAILLIGIFQLRLIGAEEAFLSAKLGAAYAAYCARVPRLWPSLRARVAGSGGRARWGAALVGEIYFWMFAAGFAALAWRYDATLLDEVALVSAGSAIALNAAFPARR